MCPLRGEENVPPARHARCGDRPPAGQRGRFPNACEAVCLDGLVFGSRFRNRTQARWEQAIREDVCLWYLSAPCGAEGGREATPAARSPATNRQAGLASVDRLGFTDYRPACPVLCKCESVQICNRLSVCKLALDNELQIKYVKRALVDPPPAWPRDGPCLEKVPMLEAGGHHDRSPCEMLPWSRRSFRRRA